MVLFVGSLFRYQNQEDMQSLTSYLGEVQDAWNDYDGEALARLLSFRDPHVMVSGHPRCSNPEVIRLRKNCSRNLGLQ